MNASEKPVDKILSELRERAKELNCLYEVQEILNTPDLSIAEICQGIIAAIPPGWQYPDVCQARLTYNGTTYQSADFRIAPWVQSTNILVQDQPVGQIEVFYTEERPIEDEGPFLKEERKLVNTIAEQFGLFILHQQLREVFQEQKISEEERKSDWLVIMDLLKRTDPGLLVRISRKMINYLSWSGVSEVEQLSELFSPSFQSGEDSTENNRPFVGKGSNSILAMTDEVFRIASRHLSQDEILENIQKWIKEDRSGFLVDTLVDPASSLDSISADIERFHFLARQGIELTQPRDRWFRVALIRRLLSEQPQFIDVAQHYIGIDDFIDFMNRVIYLPGSHGKLGGKGSGLFLANQILQKSPQVRDIVDQIRTPKTWYLTSDLIFNFLSYNNLEDLAEQKYKELSQIRQEYPYISHVFKNSPLPPDILKGLSLALDDFGDVPLIVRSSSLLEDQFDVAFAGKYKSLFIANLGTKEQRLEALVDAITEVFASMFAPDPIEYRHGHQLIDYHEEMGILIQEVVGTRVGKYYLPAFAGVAFSHNDSPWSSRINRDDGLVRMVPGLGTRAVDRLSDDYPVLVAPGKPGLRVNVTPEEIIHYSPKKIDLINLETRTFETVDIRELLKEYGDEYPLIHQLVSILRPDHVQTPNIMGVDFAKDNLVVTFDGLFSRTPFLEQVQRILSTLEVSLHHPVDIEFAHDGTTFYLLQCRSQSSGDESTPANIPTDLAAEDIIFTANRHITNGLILDITHLVYIDPQKYAELSDVADLMSVGRAVGLLNNLLPKRQFILLGPGRWGSRGDIRLGVNVSYSDINNTAMLIEIARKQRNYQPEPSFGTHFFLDLVESDIRYLPLYPDERGVIFNQAFFSEDENALEMLLPGYVHLSEVLRVVDVRTKTGGQVVQVYMNANLGEAVAVLGEPTGTSKLHLPAAFTRSAGSSAEIHWRWRLQSVETLAAQLDPHRFGVRAVYVFGSTKNATAGPQSDIDLLVHFQGTPEQKTDLLSWLEGWSLSLSLINFQLTGYHTHGLLDVHLVTDEDIKNRTSYAVKIGATSDPARSLSLGKTA